MSVLLQLGKKISNLRRVKGYSQEELAHRAGMHRTYIGSVERGEKNISFRNLCKIAEALECPLADIVNAF